MKTVVKVYSRNGVPSPDLYTTAQAISLPADNTPVMITIDGAENQLTLAFDENGKFKVLQNGVALSPKKDLF